MTAHEGITKVAKDYYDSGDADNFYFQVWGGEASCKRRMHYWCGRKYDFGNGYPAGGCGPHS